MKVILIASASFVLGYALYPLIHQSPKDKFETFVRTEVKKFTDAGDAEAKLKAADEMYGKMMLLFLAELGIRNTTKSLPLVTPSKDSCPPTVASSGSITTKQETSSFVVPPPASQKKTVLEENWTTYSTAPLIESFKGKEQRLLGRFEGSLTLQNGNTDAVVIVLNFDPQGKDQEGEALITMTDSNGKEYSRNAGRGGNHVVKKSPQDNSYYIEASPTSYFWVHFKHYPQISGKYFKKGKFVGNVELRKVGI